MRPRNVEITQFEITGISLPAVHFRVACSKGTYIRSLAHDFGAHLGCGGYLSALCREQIGDYHLRDAVEMDAILQQIRSNRNTPSQEQTNTAE